jgi:hypothetical protein
MEFSPTEVSVLAEIAEQFETISDSRLHQLTRELSSDARHIALVLAGRDADSNPEVIQQVKNLKQWARENIANSRK